MSWRMRAGSSRGAERVWAFERSLGGALALKRLYRLRAVEGNGPTADGSRAKTARPEVGPYRGLADKCYANAFVVVAGSSAGGGASGS